MAYVRPDIEKVVAGMREPQAAVKRLADSIAARAKANLDAHYHQGDTDIEVVPSPNGLDQFVCLVDQGGAAGAIERGGTRADGTPFEGLHILGRAIGS